MGTIALVEDDQVAPAGSTIRTVGTACQAVVREEARMSLEERTAGDERVVVAGAADEEVEMEVHGLVH